MPSKVKSVITNIITDALLLLILYTLLSLMGFTVSLTGLLLVVIAIVAAGIRALVRGTEHSIFAVVASLVEGLALLSLFTMSIEPTTVAGMSVSPSQTLSLVLALSIVIYMVYVLIEDTLSTN